MTYTYAHMCRMDHPQIGHNVSDDERCPLCRERDRADHIERETRDRIANMLEKNSERSIADLANIIRNAPPFGDD